MTGDLNKPGLQINFYWMQDKRVKEKRDGAYFSGRGK